MATASPRIRKRLLGVKATPALNELLEKAVSKASGRSLPTDVAPIPGDAAVSTVEQACIVLLANQQPKADHGDESLYIPISSLKAMEILIQEDSNRIDAALSQTSLVFSQRCSRDDLSPSQVRFRERIERLKLRQEESKYTKLTSNLGTATMDDDITTRSMTYAASIGLNMIIAPLSFGCFMFFFAGGILDWVFPRSEATLARQLHGAVDVRKVIVGVVSGVLMLFIEMILFVIRTNEMDKAIRKKQRRKKDYQPFGVYSANSSKTFKGE
ncbi:predicted protein [Phaeodactylum tricornutum CCAP 1055/1]|jgi:hypothetical protein|uniref:Uncharacterized protein n=2 Tax=Phaeodactylum tricornutum TaxID=2850 RepID=B7GDI9_PHATC|nr:predicted protein [Phaeodactylum tricornutum CCAP 1055/1]EEC43270.1 predicted protein [Phaeodactylum tricornutum CCAP 1055/1]|eukprot:XP_002185138.1 predicted protein [Phaeodactylum tricornutum CCAP 1055/1]